jgi:hypothetical protein
MSNIIPSSNPPQLSSPRATNALPKRSREEIDRIRDTVAMQLAEVFYRLAMYQLKNRLDTPEQHGQCQFDRNSEPGVQLR